VFCFPDTMRPTFSSPFLVSIWEHIILNPFTKLLYALSRRGISFAMLAKRATLALLAGRVLSTLASPMEPFVVQDPTAHVATDMMCDGESAAQLETGPTPEVRLDDGNFVGVRRGTTDHFLGIPFAKPP
jgi:hypothetical protein